MLPSPVAIVGHYKETPVWQLHQVAAYAVTQQRAPLVLHPSHLPWYGGVHRPACEHGTSALLGMVARHTGGQLWVVRREDDTREKDGLWPVWLLRWTREWARVAGQMPSRIRVGGPDYWDRMYSQTLVHHG